MRQGPDQVDIGDRLAGTFDHRFSMEEIDFELRSAGFEMVHFAHQPYGHSVGRSRLEGPREEGPQRG